MNRPRLLDLFCCQGGAAAGYVAAGFEVVGVDMDPQPRYPYEFHQGDALTYPLDGFDVVHASPPCQAYTAAQTIRKNVHPDLVDPIRQRLTAWGGVWTIENVPGAPLVDPIELCGTMFGLHTYRHRLFESNAQLRQPIHYPHMGSPVKMGRPLRPGDVYTAVGNFSNVDIVKVDMGVPWMTREGVRECIPPAYTAFLGKQLRAALAPRRALT